MVKRLLSVRRLVAVFGFAVALLGWVAAFVTVRGTSDLEDRLASAEAELSETRSALVQTSDELAAFRLEYREYQDMSANLEEVTGNLAGAKAVLADLLLQIDAAEARLDQQRAEAGEQQTSLTDTTRDSVTTTEGNVEAQPTTAPEQLAAAIIAKPSDAEIDAALAELDLAAFVPAGINAGDPPNWRRNAVATPDGPGGPVIAVVLDDLGLNRPNAQRAIALPGPLTLAFMTYAERLPALAAAARAAGHELLVHVPMAPQDPLTNPGPNVLRADLGPEELARRVAWGLTRFDGYVGINNHMGSGFTTSVPGMAQVMMELKARGLLYLDSLTSPGTVGAALAERLGVPYAKRDIFIDDPLNRAAIRRQLVRLERLATRTGRAVGIAHPHDVTLEELARWLPEVQARGFRLVPISAVVREGAGLAASPRLSRGSG